MQRKFDTFGNKLDYSTIAQDPKRAWKELARLKYVSLQPNCLGSGNWTHGGGVPPSTVGSGYGVDVLVQLTRGEQVEKRITGMERVQLEAHLDQAKAPVDFRRFHGTVVAYLTWWDHLYRWLTRWTPLP